MKKNSDNTGIPNRIKKWFEELSGFSFDDVRVHYNSEKPSKLGVYAYTQGNKIYIATGYESCLGHELVHIIQQKQGRVAGGIQIYEQNINVDNELENEADELNNMLGELLSSEECFGKH